MLEVDFCHALCFELDDKTDHERVGKHIFRKRALDKLSCCLSKVSRLVVGYRCILITHLMCDIYVCTWDCSSELLCKQLVTMSSTVLWIATPRSLEKAVRFGRTYRQHLHLAQFASSFCWFLAWFILRPCWRRHVPPTLRNFSEIKALHPRSPHSS
jgi:hypothetical protein